jgi:hypothetical protein
MCRSRLRRAFAAALATHPKAHLKVFARLPVRIHRWFLSRSAPSALPEGSPEALPPAAPALAGTAALLVLGICGSRLCCFVQFLLMLLPHLLPMHQLLQQLLLPSQLQLVRNASRDRTSRTSTATMFALQTTYARPVFRPLLWRPRLRQQLRQPVRSLACWLPNQQRLQQHRRQLAKNPRVSVARVLLGLSALSASS